MHQELNIQVLDPHYILLVKARPRRLGKLSTSHTIGLNLFICLLCNSNTFRRVCHSAQLSDSHVREHGSRLRGKPCGHTQNNHVSPQRAV
jgi:hypothetical protein